MKNSPEILLIEDNLGDIRLMEEALKEVGNQIKLNIVRDGVSALDYLQKTGSYSNAITPDLIFLDLNIPKKNGRRILQEIKNDPELRRIPVIILTISQAEDDIKQCYNLHANCYIIKPFEVEQLIKIVKSIVSYWFNIVTLTPKRERHYG